jgi:hypothetical protein
MAEQMQGADQHTYHTGRCPVLAVALLVNHMFAYHGNGTC